MSEELDALGYLQAVYRGKIVAESQRMKAAAAALPFERPKLAVVANVNNFGSYMEELARRSGKSNVIDSLRPGLPKLVVDAGHEAAKKENDEF